MAIYKLANAGIVSGTKYSSMLAGNPAFIPDLPAYESIATVSLTSTATSVEFTSIPNTYKHLQIRFIGKSSRASGYNDFLINVNNDTSVSYSNHILYGSGTTVTAVSAASQSTYVRILANGIPSADTTNVFASGVIDILDYANTNKYKTIRALGGVDINNNGYLSFGSILWMNTNAISSLKFTPETFSWAAYTHFALYGLQGA